jgi:60 kDa SS-A/Ro ribonucleoprotein
VDKWKQLERFLILGAEGGTYYVNERKLIKGNTAALDACAAEDPKRTVDIIVAISQGGRAPKQDASIFSLARLAGHANPQTRTLALGALNTVCRTGSFLFDFLSDIEKFRGWGRGLRRAIGGWYINKDPRELAYQVTKYQQREGESHRDALRRAHPKAENPYTNEVLSYAARKLVVPGEWEHDERPHRQVLWAVEAAKKATTEREILRLINDYDLVRECVPTQWLNSAAVWEALLNKMPMNAMVRNLAKMTTVGLIAPMSSATKTVCERLRNSEVMRKARIHPIGVLMALRTYTAGRGFRGSNTWTPVPQVTDALDDGFYIAFENVEPTNKRWFLGCDVSGSMTSLMSGTNITCAQGAGAMAMVTIRTEPQYYCHGFCHTFVDLGLSKNMRLDQVTERMFNRSFGGTDCALPMVHALQHKIPVDVFAIYTDSETWFGGIHPHQALEKYRQKMGIGAKLIVVAMVSCTRTIANPADAGMLDVSGFDASVPAVMSDFVRN